MTDYTVSGQPIAGSRGVSAPIRSEFTNIQNAVNSKANIDSPTFTGTPSAPTPTIGDSSTKLATTAFVASTAFSSALPAQAGNNGKYLQTDGTSASWQNIGNSIPSMTGQANKYLSNDGTNAVWRVLPPEVLMSVY